MTAPPDPAALDAWAMALAPARLSGGHVPDPPGAITLAEGYRLAELGAARLGTPAGWKIGATSPGAMAFLRIDGPIMGRLFAERIWRSGALADLAGDEPAEAEPEIAFLLGQPLAPGADPRAAIAAVHAAAEIVRPTHRDPFGLGAGFIVADNAAGLGALIGPELPLAALDAPGDIAVALSVSGGARCEGTADAVLGNPLNALAWLAQRLGGLPAGCWVLSGAMARAIPLASTGGEGRLTLDAGAYGSANLRF